MAVRFEIGRLIPGTQNYAEIATTQHIKQRKSNDFKIPIQQHSLAVLCNNNQDQKIRFSVWTKDNRMINAAYVTISQLSESNMHTFECKEGAQLVLEEFKLWERPQFLDYLRGGIQVSIVCAIDYTASNGNPSSSSSLHYLGNNNQYEAAIWQVGQVVEPYDHDKSFPVFGFGGIPRHMGINNVNHCFAVNGNPSNPEIPGGI